MKKINLNFAILIFVILFVIFCAAVLSTILLASKFLPRVEKQKPSQISMLVSKTNESVEPTRQLSMAITAEPTSTVETKKLSNFKFTKASLFWIGEPSDKSNAFIPNDKSAWDSHWQDNFGGLDDPKDRCGYHPCNFTPLENPFYIALPYNDLDALGKRKRSAADIPWFEEKSDKKSVLKNAWVELEYREARCYAQWEDVGPLESDDFNYVFGNNEPKNSFGVKAGIDLSPATFTCLGLKSNDFVNWRFVDENEVPSGPWKEIITDSDVVWQ